MTITKEEASVWPSVDLVRTRGYCMYPIIWTGSALYHIHIETVEVQEMHCYKLITSTTTWCLARWVVWALKLSAVGPS